jgi:hypothetical protein
LGGTSRSTEQTGTLTIPMRAKNRQWNGSTCNGQEAIASAVKHSESNRPGRPSNGERSSAEWM